VQLQILGSLEARADGLAADLGPPKQRALLAILAMHVGEIVPTDRLIDLLWGERPPRTAAHSVQIYVSELRRTLEPLARGPVIATRPPGYQLDAGAATVDAREFERLVEDARRTIEAGDRADGAAMLRSAIGLWRGPALSDFAYEEFAQPYIRRLNDLHLDAIEELARVELDAGRTAEVLSLLDAAIREDPLRERSRELLMIALYRSGRHAEALRTYERLRTVLAEELGLDPSPPLQRLQQRILVHDPALLPEGVATSAPAQSRNPYKGLRPFAEADAADFFGRDALLDGLLERIRERTRLITLVGASGSGKSSVLAAGLIPALRSGAIPGSDRWVITPLVPATLPLGDVEAIRSDAGGGRQVLVMDQFEDLFSATDEALRRRFLRALAAAVSEPGGELTVLLALRADHYDRPLQDPEFAPVFIPSVVNVLPMTAQELEAAVVEPAARAGVTVEPSLLAELVAETADQAGALPLLQYTLTELFDQRDGSSLTIAGYRALGGLKAILSRRAETLYSALGAEAQQAAMQLFTRLVRLGRGTIDSPRRVPLSELTDLGLDPVALSEVLDAFGRYRLLSFDRDVATGEPTVELAHEALLREWERLAAWIERHRGALRRHETFVAAMEEWERSDRHPDYLLTGGRLSEFESWSKEGILRLTNREGAFLEAGLERRTAQREQEARRVELARRIQRRARLRIAAGGVAVALLAGAIGYGVWAAGAAAVPQVVLLHPGRDVIDALNRAGFDRAVADFGLVGKQRVYDERTGGGEELRSLAEDGADLIVVTSATGDDFAQIVGEFPATHFVVILHLDEPNVTYVRFADEDGAFLAGAAAALKSRTRTVGFIGAIDHWFVWPFQAGFEAGAHAVDPKVRVLSAYLAKVPDFSTGFGSPPAARRAAQAMYRQGADVVFHATGASGVGVFQAAAEMSVEGRHLWAIGVDTDQFETVRSLEGAVDPDVWRAHILTSMIKRFDVATYAIVADFARHELGRVRVVDLTSGALDLSYSGGFIEDVRSRIETFKASIIAGDIDVPCVPVSREAEAREQGVMTAACGGS